jgi:competence ComEA-like helix-hairpin-helix protein
VVVFIKRYFLFKKLFFKTTDIWTMKPTPTQTALLLLMLALTVATTAARIRDLYRQKEISDRDSSLKKSFCVGVEHPEIGSGLVCADGPEKIIDEAVSKLNLPLDCNKIPLPPSLNFGERIAFSDQNGSCALVRIDRLPAGIRLIIGRGVNLDSWEDLALLPGIGAVKARRLIEDRERNGPFRDMADLTRVQGIGHVTADRLEPWIEWE